MSKRFFTLLLLVFLFSFFSFATAVAYSIKTSFDKSTVDVDSEILFKIEISDPDLSKIKRPEITGQTEDFDIIYVKRSNNFTFIEGESVPVVVFEYKIVPHEVGTFDFPGLHIKIGEYTYVSEPFVVNVVSLDGNRVRKYTYKTSGMEGYPSNKSFTDTAKLRTAEELFARIEVDKSEAYVNEQIVASYVLYTRISVEFVGVDREIDGFWKNEVNSPAFLERDEAYIDGHRYVRAVVKITVLFPMRSGHFKIDAGNMKLRVKGEAGKEVLIPIKPVEIDVLPFPNNGKPVNFNGLCGEFKMYGGLENLQVNAGEAAALKIAIEGKGNIAAIPPVSISEVSGLEIYDGETTVEIDEYHLPIRGKKVFSYAVIPAAEGNYTIDKITIAYFNPKYKHYMYMSAGPFSLNVIAGKTNNKLNPPVSSPEYRDDIVIKGNDVEYIKENISENDFTRNMFVLAVIFDIFSFLFLVYAIYVYKYNLHLDADRDLKRSVFADKMLKNNIPVLKNLASSNEGKFFELLQKVLHAYIAAKLNIDDDFITWKKLESGMADEKIEKDVLEKAREIENAANSYRFSGKQYTVESLKEYIKVLETIHKALR